MSEWGIALIAAGSAVAGSIVTGWYTRSAGIRQADAAKHAGDRQADALLHTVQATLDDQRRARLEEQRRRTYTALLDAVHDLTADQGNPELNRDLQKAVTQVVVEGPAPVALAALHYVTRMRDWSHGSAHVDDVTQAQTAYIDAVRAALGIGRDT